MSKPSPITIQVPNRTKSSKAMCKDLCFSSTNFTLELCFEGGGGSSLYVDRASSATCLLGRRLTLACLHIRVYRANVPPAVIQVKLQVIYTRAGKFNQGGKLFIPSPLSSARRTMKTYLQRGTSVRVQKTKERTPKISSFVSE